MRLSLLVTLCLLSTALALPLANAEPQWLPVCNDKDIRAGGVAHLHVGVDCYPGVWLDICPPGQACQRVDLGRVLV